MYSYAFILCSFFINCQCLPSNFAAKTADLAITYLAISTLEDQVRVFITYFIRILYDEIVST